MRRASIDTLERIMKDVTLSKAEHTRERRLSLTMMNCIWARNTDKETLNPVEGEIFGDIPDWLDGTLYRVGPGVIQVGDACFNHPFEMLSVIHKYNISTVALSAKSNSNKDSATRKIVTYQNKIVDSRARSMQESLNNVGSIATSTPSASSFSVKVHPDPFKNKLKRFRDRFTRVSHPDPRDTPSDNCIDNICFFGNEMYILSDIPHMLRIDPKTLETIYECDIEEYAPVVVCTSHPHVETDGTIWNIGTSYSKNDGYSYSVLRFSTTNNKGSKQMNVGYQHSCPGSSRVNQIESGQLICKIGARNKNSPAYFHSFALSEEYIIFIEQPLFLEESISSTNMVRGTLRVPGTIPVSSTYGTSSKYQSLKWKGNEWVRFYLINKLTGKVLPTIYHAMPFFFFHVINAFDDEQGFTVVDILAYKDAEILCDLKFSHIERTDHVPSAKAMRFMLPTKISPENMRSDRELAPRETTHCSSVLKIHGSGTLEVQMMGEELVPETLEYPRFNYTRLGKKYEYFYALGNEYLHPNKILKIDIKSRDVSVWKEPGHFVSEPIFVSRPTEPKDKEEAVEDAGVVIFTLLNVSPHNTVQLMILDAASLQELARIKFRAHGTVTEGFHGIFVKSSAAKALANDTDHDPIILY